MQRRSPPLLPAHQKGVGLLEVLIAVLVLGVGLLGIAAMQATALRNSQSSIERSQAVIFTYSILDAIRANREAGLAGDYNLGAFTCAPPSGSTLAKNDLSRWITGLRSDLSSTACGLVSCTAAGVCTITVRWDDSRGSQGSSAQSVQTVSRI